MAKILAIDDKKDTLTILSELAENHMPGCMFIQALSGERGLELAALEQPDVILLNNSVPDTDSIEICRQLKKNELTSAIPVIFQTDNTATKQDRLKALEYGADLLLTEPVDECELFAQISVMLRIKDSNDLKKNESDCLAELVDERTVKLEAELAERRKTADGLRNVLEKLEISRKATLNLADELRAEIEARKRTEEDIREREEIFAKAFRSSPVAMILTNIEKGMITDVNEGFLSLSGYKYDEVIGKTGLSLNLWESVEDRANVIDDVMMNVKVAAREYRFVKKSGEKIICLYSAELVIINKQQYLLSNISDLTRQKKNEQELIDNQERLLSLARISEYNYSSVNDLQYYALDEALKLTKSKAGYIFNYNEETRQFELNTWSKNVAAQCSVQNQQIIYQLENTGVWGETVRQRKELVMNDFHAWHPAKKGLPDGHIKLDRFMSIPVFDEHKIAAVIGVANKDSDYTETDILQLKLLMSSVWKIIQRNQIIEKNLMLLRAIESSSNSIIITNAKGDIEYTNPSFTLATGYTLEEVLGKNPRILKSGMSSQEEYRILWKTIVAGREWRGEFHNKKKDGTLFWELASISPVKDLNGKTAHFIAVKEDITERKKIEVALRRSEMEFRKVWESSLDGMRLTDPDGIIIKVNEAFCKMVNMTREQLEGRPLTIIYPSENNGIEVYKKRFRERTIKPLIEAQINLRDRTIWFEVAASIISLDENELAVLSIFRDITIRKQAELEIIKAKERAEEMNRLKSSFLNNMSHELRTPLIGILGFSEIFLESLNDPEQREMAECILKGGKRLYETLNLILNITKLEAGKFPMSFTEINLGSSVRTYAYSYEAIARQKNISITITIEDENAIVLIDDKMLEQIVGNLVNNAIKFTDSGGVIVEVKSETLVSENGIQKWCLFRVIDTGIGIREEDFELIFDEFRQVSEGLSRGFEGTGLGLSITKKFVEKMNGKITVQSRTGEGSIFTVSFPSIESLKLTEIITDDTEKENNINGVPEFGPELPAVLLVDDDETTCRLTKRFLEDICEIDTVLKANAAIQKVRENRYKLILMDINLGYGMNGISAKNEIRKIQGYEKVPIVAFTAYAMPDEQQELLNTGFDHYFSKPFIKNDLVLMVKSYIEPQKAANTVN